jgi:hypothetical protein
MTVTAEDETVVVLDGITHAFPLRLEFETEIKSQIKHSLTTILERLS